MALYSNRFFVLFGNNTEKFDFRRYFNWIVIICLTLAIGIVYLPMFNAYFISDDFQFLSYLHLNVRQLLDGQKWEEWFIGGIVQYSFFRPIGNLSWLLDFITYGFVPLGYHLTSVILHVLASFEVFLLGCQLTSKRMTAGIAALLFAVMPVHAEAVSFTAARYDELAGLFYLGSLIFFILDLRRHNLRFYLISLGAFVLALASKETALTLPVILLLYQVLFNFQGLSQVTELAKRHIPFWLIVGVRLVWFGHGYSNLQLDPSEGWWYWVDGNLLRVVDPWVSDLSSELRWLLLGSAVFLLLAYRLRREIVLSLTWIPITLVPTISGGLSDRSFYIPSFGLSLLIAVVLTSLASRRMNALKAFGVVTLFTLVIGYSMALIARNQAYDRAGQVSAAIPRQIKSLQPTISSGSRLVLVGVPDQVPEGPLVYITGLRNAVQIEYDNPSLGVFKYAKFPIWLDDLDRTYFFQVDHRQVTERTDLIQALEQRKQCDTFSTPAIIWNFSNDVQGWEPWNQLSDFAIRDGSLSARSEGIDPYMASPMIDIPSISIGDVMITMRVQSSKPEMIGKVYWLGTGQGDFSPALQMPFTVLADGEYHTYRVDLSHSNQLLLDDHILRLRLNPVDDNAEIEIKAIQVYSHCSELQGNYCRCSN